jgi:hypothetical protein
MAEAVHRRQRPNELPHLLGKRPIVGRAVRETFHVSNDVIREVADRPRMKRGKLRKIRRGISADEGFQHL